MFSHQAIREKRYSRGIFYLNFINVFKFRSEGDSDQNLAGIFPCPILNLISLKSLMKIKTSKVQNQTREWKIPARFWSGSLGSKLENIDKF